MKRTYHPLHRCNDGKFNTATGRVIDLQLPTVDMIHIEDIARSLSHICRFGGHVNRFYSVAEHSLLVTALAPKELKPYALLHDAAEAYLGDVIKPLKNLIGSPYDMLEGLFTQRIAEVYGLDPEGFVLVKPFDLQALEVEHELLQRNNDLPMQELKRCGYIQRYFMTPEAAEVRMRIAFDHLFPEHSQGDDFKQQYNWVNHAL